VKILQAYQVITVDRKLHEYPEAYLFPTADCGILIQDRFGVELDRFSVKEWETWYALAPTDGAAGRAIIVAMYNRSAEKTATA
jgi:hypothetical protein